MDRDSLENAIRALAGDPKLFARFKEAPSVVGQELGLTAEGIEILQRGDRGRLRSLGLNDGLTILVSRWFNDDLGDSSSSSGFYVDTSPSSSFFYLLTGMHGIHLFGGIIALLASGAASLLRRSAVSRGVVVDATAWYWHFMTALWVYILCLLEFAR